MITSSSMSITYSTAPLSLLFLMSPRPTRSSLFPYTTLFRSPLARAIVSRAQADGVQAPAGTDISSTPALGVKAQVDGHEIRVGGPRLLEETGVGRPRSEEHTSELQSRGHLVCRLLREKKKTKYRMLGE